MKTLARKQRELHQREQLILDTAAEILEAEGYLGLNMDRVAEAIAYSKGTIYQHFSCKEDILCALSIRSMEIQLGMFRRVKQFKAYPREKMVASLVAHQIFVKLYRREFNNLLVIKNASIRNKISKHSLARLRASEEGCFQFICSFVEEAVQNGDLELHDTPPAAIVYGFWCMAFGSSMLQTIDFPFGAMNNHDPDDIIRAPCRYALDGFGWKPLSHTFDYSMTYHRIYEELFPQEIQQLNEWADNDSSVSLSEG